MCILRLRCSPRHATLPRTYTQTSSTTVCISARHATRHVIRRIMYRCSPRRPPQVCVRCQFTRSNRFSDLNRDLQVTFRERNDTEKSSGNPECWCQRSNFMTTKGPQGVREAKLSLRACGVSVIFERTHQLAKLPVVRLIPCHKATVGCSNASIPRARSLSVASRPPRSHRTDRADLPPQVRGKLNSLGDASARPVHPAAIVRAAISQMFQVSRGRLSVSFAVARSAGTVHMPPPGSPRYTRRPLSTVYSRRPRAPVSAAR